MKCLSISQPFSDLIIKKKKTIELRSWNTKFRGEFLIHAPKKLRRSDCKRLKIKESSLVTGAIIGKAEIYDVKKYNSAKDVKQDFKSHLASDKFLNKKYGFLLKNVKAFRIPIPSNGKLGFFDVELEKLKIKKSDIELELFDEEYRYQWINHH